MVFISGLTCLDLSQIILGFFLPKCDLIFPNMTGFHHIDYPLSSFIFKMGSAQPGLLVQFLFILIVPLNICRQEFLLAVVGKSPDISKFLWPMRTSFRNTRMKTPIRRPAIFCCGLFFQFAIRLLFFLQDKNLLFYIYHSGVLQKYAISVSIYQNFQY